MRKFITITILSLLSFSAFAQYNDTYEVQGEEQYLVNQLNKGHEQVAVGGIVLSTTMVFDIAYYGILANSLKKPNADYDQIYTASVIGCAVTCVGVVASLWQFALGHSNIKRANYMMHFNENGALCISLPERTIRRKPVPSWKK